MQARSLVMVVSLAAAGMGGGPAPSAAQAPPVDAPEVRPADDFPDVYVDESIEARESLDRAATLVAQQRWVEAARLLDDAAERNGDKLVERSPGRYGSVVREVRETLCGWTTDGLKQYRELVDGAARAALIAGVHDKSLPRLLSAFERYFCSTSRPQLGEAAAELAIEAGDFAVARRIHQLLLTDHPDAAAHGDVWRAKQAIAEALLGDAPAVGSYLARESRGVELQWLGALRPVERILDEIHATFTTGRPALRDGDWPTFGGSAARDESADPAPEQLAKLWRFDAFGPQSPSTLASVDRGYGYRRVPDFARLLAMNPVFGEGLLVVQDALKVWAVRADSGCLAWDFAASSTGSAETMNDESVAPWYAATIARGRVFACLGQNLVPYYGYAPSARQSAVVCLDLRDGREVWRRDETSAPASFARIDYDGAPLVIDGALYVIERRRRAFGFEDCALLCLDADTGEQRYRTHLGSASTGGFGYRRATLAIPAADAERVYVATNLGAVAAVFRHTGAVDWLCKYRRDAPDDAWRRASASMLSWRYNAPQLDRGRLICLPTDISRVLICQPQTGAIVREIDAEALGGADCLLGVREGRLYGVGREAFAYDLDAGRLSWTRPLPAGERLYGRGLLTARGVLVPTERGLCTFALADGALSQQAWPEPGAGGNLLSVGDRLFVVGVAHVDAYADKEKVWQRLRARMDAEPDDPAPALDLAEIAFRSGESAEAVAALAEAAERTGGLAALTDAALKKRIFDDCLAFAAGGGEGPESLARRERLLRLAAQCPPDKRAHISYRLRLAELCEQTGRPREAVDLYQQLIADESLRPEPMPAAAGAPRASVGEYGIARIEALIRTDGRRVYADYDRQAAELAESGRAAGDLAALERVAYGFPNALAARTAQVYRGDLLRAEGRFREAARAYYHVFTASRGSAAPPARPELAAQIVTCHADAGRHIAARWWLAKASRDFPDARVSFEGASLNWAALREALGYDDEPVEPAAPAIRPPLAVRFERRFAEPVTLLAPTIAATPGSSWLPYFVYAGQGLAAFDASRDAALWQPPTACRPQPALLHVDARRAIFATPYEIFACGSADGRRLWTVGEYPVGRDDARADPEDFPVYRHHALDGARLVSIRTDGRATAIDPADGRELWSRVFEAVPAGPVALADDLMAYPATRLGRSVCCVVDPADGRVREVIELAVDAAVDRVLLPGDGSVVAVSAAGLYAFDGESGAPLWHIGAQQPLSPSTVLADRDGVYAAPDGRRVIKLRLTDGQPIWETPLPFVGKAQAVRLMVRAGRLFVLAEERAAMLDAESGSVRYAPLNAVDGRIVAAFVIDAGFVQVETARAGDEESLSLHVYDCSGETCLPAEDGVDLLERCEDVRAVVLCDDALVIQDGQRILGLAAKR